MLQTSLGIGLITVGSLSMLAGVVYWFFGVFGRKAASASSALTTVIEAPAPMWVGDPNAQPQVNDETLDELFSEIFTLRSMVGDLSRDIRVLKSQLASMSDDDAAPQRLRRAA